MQKKQNIVLASNRMVGKFQFKVFDEEAFGIDHSYVDEEDMNHGDTNDIHMPNSSGRQLQLMPSTSTLDDCEISISNLQTNCAKLVHVVEKW